MANDGGVAAKLAGAKKTLEGAKNSNVSGRGGAPKSAAPVKPASAAGSGIMDSLKKMAGKVMDNAKDNAKTGDDTAAGLKAKIDNVNQYKAAEDKDVPKMHKGGKVEKDGVHNLKKNEVVVTEKDAKKMGIADGVKKAAGTEKSEKKDKKDEPKKKKHKGKHSHIVHHGNGSHTLTVGMDDGTEQSSAHPDDASMMAAMSQQLQGSPEGAPEGGAPEGGAPAPAQA